MMRRCRHLEAFEVTTKVLDESKSGLPPWAILCEDCSATVFDGLKLLMAQASGKSGKSSAAVNWARARRLIGDLEEGR